MDVKGLRVALVVGTSAGGVGRHVAAVARELAARGARVVVCGPRSTEETFGFAGAGVRFAEVDIADRPRPVGDVRAVARLRRLVRDADVVHAHGLRAGALAVLASGRVVPGLRGGPPVIVTLHNALIAGGAVGAVYAVLERVVAAGSAAALGVSPDLEERLRALGARNVGRALVPSPPHRPAEAGARGALRHELGADGRAVVLTVGRLADQKGLPDLLDAAATVRDLEPLFVVAGDGPLDGALRDRIAAEELPVRLLGRRGDVPALLAASDVVVVPSLWEGQPLFVQEALEAGKPLVATEVGGIPLMVGEAAVLVPPGDGAALGAALRRILADPALAARLGEAAGARAAGLPTQESAVDDLVGVYSVVRS